MELNYKLVGKRIEGLRKRRGMSQFMLSEEIKKSPPYISYIESGVKRMSLETFVAIANALHCSADALLLDSLENTLVVSNHEFSNLLTDCSEYEIRILYEVAKSAKRAIRANRDRLIQLNK